MTKHTGTIARLVMLTAVTLIVLVARAGAGEIDYGPPNVEVDGCTASVDPDKYVLVWLEVTAADGSTTELGPKRWIGEGSGDVVFEDLAGVSVRARWNIGSGWSAPVPLAAHCSPVPPPEPPQIADPVGPVTRPADPVVATARFTG